MYIFTENQHSKLWVADGLLYFIYKPIPYLDLETAKKIVSDRLQYQQHVYFPILCDTRGIKDSEKTARDYLAKEGSTLAKAVAILDDRNVSRVMHRFYLRHNQPVVPTQVFSTQEAAITYLAAYK